MRKEKITWEESSHEVAISRTDNLSQAFHVLGTSTAVVCTDTQIPDTAADSSRPESTSRWTHRTALPRSLRWRTAAFPSSSLHQKLILSRRRRKHKNKEREKQQLTDWTAVGVGTEFADAAEVFAVEDGDEDDESQ